MILTLAGQSQWLSHMCTWKSSGVFNVIRTHDICDAGACFSKVPKTFRTRKAIRKTPTRLFCYAGLFISFKGNKNLNNCKVSCLETPLLWRYKENYVTQDVPEKFRDFRETGPWCSAQDQVTELWNHSDLNRSIFWAHEFPWKEWERNFCKVWLRYHLKKWSSHLLDNFSNCLICAPEKGHFFNSSFLSREHMSPTNWPAHIWVASKLCWLEYYTSIAEDTWLFSGAHETIAEIVQQVWGPFLQFISQPH